MNLLLLVFWRQLIPVDAETKMLAQLLKDLKAASCRKAPRLMRH